MSTLKALLINPSPFLQFSAGNFHRFYTPMPPIGLAYLLAIIEKSGNIPLFYDDCVEMADNDKLSFFLKNQAPQVIGIPLYTSSTIYRVEEIVKTIRNIYDQVHYPPTHLLILNKLQFQDMAQKLQILHNQVSILKKIQ
ncbi:MAG: hypothetical protein HQK51_12860, partial [Oligoflexia bacterium]|nr:hypothetical protein [Oligoflexia bacterium]